MARKAFYSFHFDGDHWRASMVRNIGVIEGNQEVTDNEWESVKRGGDAAIERWIKGQMAAKDVLIVLIGSATAGRPWVEYEIKEAWNSGKGVVGVYIHGLKDRNSRTSSKGANPFDAFTVGGVRMSSIVKVYDPGAIAPYGTIKDGLANWVEEAIRIRNQY